MASPPSETLLCLTMAVLWVGLVVPLLSHLWPHKAKAAVGRDKRPFLCCPTTVQSRSVRFRNPWRHHKVEGAALRKARSLCSIPDKK